MKTIVTAAVMTMAIALTFAVADAQPYRWGGNQKNTYGWQLMTQQERTDHQAKLRSFKEYNACKEYVDEHHKSMEVRAKEKGITTPMVKGNPCDIMKTRGVLK